MLTVGLCLRPAEAALVERSQNNCCFILGGRRMGGKNDKVLACLQEVQHILFCVWTKGSSVSSVFGGWRVWGVALELSLSGKNVCCAIGGFP